MAYVAVVKALYDYTAQDPEDEISFKEDQLLYIIEKGDDEWWKAKLKEDLGGEGPIGLIPCTYVEEIPAISSTRALYEYESTSPEELTMAEDDVLQVYAEEEEWLLVRVDGGDERLGFVPKNYCEPLDAAGEAGAGGASAAAAAAVQAQHAAEEERAAAAERQRQLKLQDKLEMWSISEVEGSLRKKGTLSVGNGAIFFASETDKSPVKQYPIEDLAYVERQSSKVITLTIATLGQPLVFNTGAAGTAEEIIAKLTQSKETTGEALQVSNAASGATSEEDDSVSPPPEVAKSVRWAEDATPAAPPAAASRSIESCVVLYDFEAGGEDELSVTEGESLSIVEKENDEWWLVRNARGQEGVVPAQYVEIAEGGASPASPPQNGHVEAAAAAAAAQAAQREEQARKAEEQRRAIEAAAREREAQEAADRAIAEQVAAEERLKRDRAMQAHQEDERRMREMEAAKRREAARRSEPPKVSKRPSAQDVEVAARNLPSGKNKSTPERPKPNPAKTRVWSDRTGQFKVEAEFLGMNGNKLRLHKMNGVIIEVPLEKMSQEDVNMIRRYMSKKDKRRSSSTPPDDDDVPLAKTQPRRPSQQVSYETQHRREARSQRPPKAHFDWFAFFLEAGCDVDDCTRYASNFDRDRIDETILADLDASTLRSLGLREGDVIRVRKAIQAKYGKKEPQQQNQIDKDEELARKLQEQENAGKGPAAPAPGLFTGADGKLANNTRRGRPERKNTAPESVDPAALSAATEQLAKVSIASPIEPARKATPPPAAAPIAPSPPPAPPVKEVDLLKEEPPKPTFSFDDDAWTIKPSAKPASPAPAPPAAAPSPAPAKGSSTDALLAQIQAMRPAATGAPPGGSELAEAAQAGASGRAELQRQAASMPPPSAYGLGAGNSAAPMSQLQQQQQQQMQAPQLTLNGPRGPLAPVSSNEPLLNPLQPARTGFVPTHASGNGMMQQPTGMMPQQTGYMSPGMSPGGYGQQQPMQAAYTGFPGFQQQQQPQQSAFNAVAGMQVPPPAMPQQQQQQSGGGDQFAPSNIFQAMKRTDFSKGEAETPQPAGKYDALRPLTTGYNGGPMGMQPTGMGMGMQQTGMPMQYGQMGMQGQYGGGMGGMMPNMTGYNPYMQQQQQNPFGY